MTQPSPTPVPNHGTGWGLLLHFIGLYGIVALLGAGTVVAIAVTRFERRLPRTLQYLLVAVLFGALGLTGFILLVATTARQYDVVALLLFVVFLPLTLVVLRRRGTAHGLVAILTRAAMAWSLPFFAGFSVVAFVGTRSGGVPPEIAGVAAVIIVVAGTIAIERSSLFPGAERPQK